MKSLLLIISLLLFVDFRDQVKFLTVATSFQGSVSSVALTGVRANPLTLNSIKTRGVRHILKRDFKTKFLKLKFLSFRKKNVSNKLLSITYTVISKQAFYWGPQNLPTPPPFRS